MRFTLEHNDTEYDLPESVNSLLEAASSLWRVARKTPDAVVYMINRGDDEFVVSLSFPPWLDQPVAVYSEA